MPIALRFNGGQFYSDLRDRLVVAMDEVNSDFYRAATSGMSAEAKADTERNNSVIEKETDYKGELGHSGSDEEYINARCKFYADAILESFGTGSLSDRGEFSQWDEYEKSKYFNPARKGRMKIVGRPKGEYINIWGEEAESTGKNVGKNLEGIFKPKKPTYAIQNAEVWLMQDRETSMERRIQLAVEQFISEMNDNPMKYFYYVEV